MHQIATAKNIDDCLVTVWEGLLPRADAGRPWHSLAGLNAESGLGEPAP